METNLSKLLSMLETSSQKNEVGTLILCQKEDTFEIYIENQKIYLTSEKFLGKVDLHSLSILQQRDSKFDSSHLESILQSTNLQSNVLAEALQTQGLIDQSDFEFLVCNQLIEEILHVAEDNQGSIFFQRDHIPEKLIGSKSLVANHPIALEDVLKATRNRIQDHKKISQFIPDSKEVFVLTERGMATQHDDLGLKQIFPLLDGFRDLSTVIEVSNLFANYIEIRIIECLQEGWIKKTLLPEIRNTDPTTLSLDEAERYIPIYKTAIKYGADELLVRQKFAQLLLHLDKVEEAVIQFNFIGDTLFQMGKRGQALQAYFEGLKLSGNHTMIGEKILRIYHTEANERHAHGQSQEAIKLYKNALEVDPDHRETLHQLLDLLVESKDLKAIMELCDYVRGRAKDLGESELAFEIVQTALEALPGQPTLIRKRINLLLDFNQYAEALDEMESLALHYIQNGNIDKGSMLVDKILRMDSSRSHLYKYSKTPPSGVEKERMVKKKRFALRACLLLVVAALCYQLYTYFLLDDIRREQSRALDAKSLSNLPQTLGEENLIIPGPRERELHSLSEKAEAFIRSHPLSFFRLEAKALGKTFTDACSHLKELRSQHKNSILDEITQLLSQGKLATAKTKLKLLSSLPADDAVKIKANQLYEESSKEDTDAESLFERSLKYRKEGKLRETTDTLKLLVKKFPKSRWASQASFPIHISSAPLQVTLKTRDGRLLTTPCELEVPAGEDLTVFAEKIGFHSKRFKIKFDAGPQVKIVLSQVPLWKKNPDLDDSPKSILSTKMGVYTLTNSGSVYQLDPMTGDQKALYLARDLTQPISEPIVCDSYLILLLNNGEIRRYKSGHLKGAPLKTNALITSQVAHLESSQRIALETTSGKILTYDPRSHRIVSSFLVPEGLDQLQYGGKNRVLGVTKKNQMFLVDLKTKETHWKVNLGSKISSGPYPLGGVDPEILAFLNQKGQIHTYTLKDGHPLRVDDFPKGSPFVAFLPKSHRVLSVNDQGQAILTNLISREIQSLGSRENLKLGGLGAVKEYGEKVAVIQQNGHFQLLDGEELQAAWISQPSKNNKIISRGLFQSKLILLDSNRVLTGYDLPK